MLVMGNVHVDFLYIWFFSLNFCVSLCVCVFVLAFSAEFTNNKKTHKIKIWRIHHVNERYSSWICCTANIKLRDMAME